MPNNYMVMQNPNSNIGAFPQGNPIGGLRQVKDSKKNEWQLAAEVNDLKQQRNKDVNHIKILKVELHKLEQTFKKYKESLSPESVPQVQLENLPSLITMAQQPNMIDTEMLLIEIQRIKGQLQQEITMQKYTDTPSQGPRRQSHNDTTVISSHNNTQSYGVRVDSGQNRQPS